VDQINLFDEVIGKLRMAIEAIHVCKSQLPATCWISIGCASGARDQCRPRLKTRGPSTA
jgi:hypothetical protein